MGEVDSGKGQESLMFHLVQFELNLFLVARGPTKPEALEAPLQLPVGHFSLENQ